MHRVLEIPELQFAIAQELKTPRLDWRSRRRQDLYNLSLVSHSWRSVAESMRWEEGNRLEDFLRVLPSDAWARVITEVEDWYLDTFVLKKIRARVRGFLFPQSTVVNLASVVPATVDMSSPLSRRLERGLPTNTLRSKLDPAPACRVAGHACESAFDRPSCRHPLSEAVRAGP